MWDSMYVAWDNDKNSHSSTPLEKDLHANLMIQLHTTCSKDNLLLPNSYSLLLTTWELPMMELVFFPNIFEHFVILPKKINKLIDFPELATGSTNILLIYTTEKVDWSRRSALYLALIMFSTPIHLKLFKVVHMCVELWRYNGY